MTMRPLCSFLPGGQRGYAVDMFLMEVGEGCAKADHVSFRRRIILFQIARCTEDAPDRSSRPVLLAKQTLLSSKIGRSCRLGLGVAVRALSLH